MPVDDLCGPSNPLSQLTQRINRGQQAPTQDHLHQQRPGQVNETLRSQPTKAQQAAANAEFNQFQLDAIVQRPSESTFIDPNTTSHYERIWENSNLQNSMPQLKMQTRELDNLVWKKEVSAKIKMHVAEHPNATASTKLDALGQAIRYGKASIQSQALDIGIQLFKDFPTQAEEICTRAIAFGTPELEARARLNLDRIRSNEDYENLKKANSFDSSMGTKFDKSILKMDDENIEKIQKIDNLIHAYIYEPPLLSKL